MVAVEPWKVVVDDTAAARMGETLTRSVTNNTSTLATAGVRRGSK
jgi:hypothetical protein